VDDQNPAALEALVADIIDMTKLREAQTAGDATARLHDVLCRAAEATATGALNTRGRLLLAAGVARAALGRPPRQPRTRGRNHDGLTVPPSEDFWMVSRQWSGAVTVGPSGPMPQCGQIGLKAECTFWHWRQVISGPSRELMSVCD
jgi:hypothetical protein